MSEELIPTNLLIGDRNYRVRIAPKDEEVVRKTVKTINDKLIEYKTQFAGKDMQDYIAMVLIWYATQPASSTNNEQLEKELSAALSKIEQQIDKGL